MGLIFVCLPLSSYRGKAIRLSLQREYCSYRLFRISSKMNCPKQYHCVDSSAGVCIGIPHMPRSVNLRYRLILINLGKRLALHIGACAKRTYSRSSSHLGSCE